MILPRLALRNPHAVVVFVFSVVLIGLSAAGRIPVDLLPQFRTPAVQVVTFYPGMAAETIERDISTRIQRWTGQSVGIEHQEAKSMLGVSIVKDFFREDISPDAAMAQVTSYAMSDLYYLPPGTIPPMVMPFDPTATIPLCLLSVKSEAFNETQLYDIAYFQLRNRLQSIQGVIAPAVYGGKLRRILAYLDRESLLARGLAPMDVVRSINSFNVFIPTGSARLGSTEYYLDSNAMVPEVKALNEFPIRLGDGGPVMLRDVAQAEDSAELQSNIVRVDGKRQLYVPVYRQPGANTIRVVEGVKEAIPELNKRLPAGINLDVVFDQSIFVRKAMASLAGEAMLGALLAFLMVILFLGSLRSGTFVLVSLPVSLFAAVIGLYFTDQTINIMTLGGMAIAVGLLIDQSIVVLENIERKREAGLASLDAAFEGAKEVAAPLFVIVAGTCIVFLPIIFLTGIGRFLFSPLALAVTFAMFASYVVALTVIPACADRYGGSSHSARNATGDAFACWYASVESRYRSSLSKALLRPRRVIAAASILFACSLALLPFIGNELFPQIDSGQFSIRVRAGSGTRVEATEALLVGVEEAVRATIGKENLEKLISNIGVLNDWPAAYTPNSGPHDAFVLVQLRSASESDWIPRLRETLRDRFPGVEFAFERYSMLRAALNFGLPAPIDIQVQGNDLHTSLGIAHKIRGRIREIAGLADVRIQQRLDYPLFRAMVDRVKAASLGLTQEDVIKNVVTAFNSSVSFAKSFWIDERNGNHYWIGAQYPEREFEDLGTLLDVPITGQATDQPILLRDLVMIERGTAPSEVMHHNINRVIDIYADVEGTDLGRAMEKIETELSAIEKEGLPSGYSIVRRGEYRSMRESFANLRFGMLLAVVLVYLLMVIQFRSYVDPLIVMFAIPLGMIGVSAVLFLTSTTFNIQSLMGVMMMIGIVKSFSLMLVDFARRRQESGARAYEAVLDAATIRLRPILMTSLAAALGLMPMAFVGGANIPLARAVVGGVVASTALMLYVVPALYLLVHGGTDDPALP